MFTAESIAMDRRQDIPLYQAWLQNKQVRVNNEAYFNLNYGNLDEIPREVLESTACVTKLWLKHNLLKSLPTDLWKLSQLVELYVPANKLRNIPDEIGKLKTLQRFNVDNNFLKTLPKTIGGLVSLKKLQISNNELEIIPPEVGQLENLEVIEAVNNRLSMLPGELSRCSNLTTILVDKNNIKEIPIELLKLVKLKELSMCRNNLSHLPHDLNKLCCLECLAVDNNPSLMVIPSTILAIQSLKTLGLNGCASKYRELDNTEKVYKWYYGIEGLKIIEGNIPQLLELCAQAYRNTDSDQKKLIYLPSSLRRQITSPKGHCFCCQKPYFFSTFVHISDVNKAFRMSNIQRTLYSQLEMTKCYFAFCCCSSSCLLQLVC